MKNAYPIVMTPAEEGGYIVYIPDFDINTQGETLFDAIMMSRDAIGLIGLDIEDNGKSLPTPTNLNVLKQGKGDIATLVDVDFTQYRKRNSNRAVKKNCSIPEWLNDAAMAKGINFSQVLQDALKEKMGY